MSNSSLIYRQEFYKALIEWIAHLAGIPIGLYEIHDGQVEAVIPEALRSKHEKHCQLIQSFPGGRQRCEADQTERAKSAFRSDEGHINQCCWAGVYNESVPIKIDGKSIALLVYGGTKVGNEDYKRQSLANHHQAVSTLGLTESQAAELRDAFLSVKHYSHQEFVMLANLLSKAEQWMNGIIQEEKRAKDILERNTHEINTRLQSVIAYAENLLTQMVSSDYTEAKKTAYSILEGTASLDTVVQSLGDYLEEYRFNRRPLTVLVDEAIKIYEAEASRRGVEIIQRLEGAHNNMFWVDISRRHLQYALNNLIHNAIKYSFRGSPKRQRYVSIEGQPEKNFYRLTISSYGAGILPEEYEKIFLDGYRGRLTRGEFRTGSGKGLHFVKRVIELHHGKIEVESKLRVEQETPEGHPHLNKFTVRLPYHQPKGI
jgi:signal transduction histidine kinase